MSNLKNKIEIMKKTNKKKGKPQQLVVKDMSTAAISYNKSVKANTSEKKGLAERLVNYFKENQEIIVLGLNSMCGRCVYPYGRN